MTNGNIGQLGIEMVAEGTAKVVSDFQSAFGSISSASFSMTNTLNAHAISRSKIQQQAVNDILKSEKQLASEIAKIGQSMFSDGTARKAKIKELEQKSSDEIIKIKEIEAKKLSALDDQEVDHFIKSQQKLALHKQQLQKESDNFLKQSSANRVMHDYEQEQIAKAKSIALAREAAEQRKQLATSVATHINAASRSVINDIGILTRFAGFALTLGGGLAVHNVVSNLIGQQRAAADVSIASNGNINAHQAMDLSRELSHKYNIEEQPLLEASASYERLRKGGGASAMSIMPEMAKLSYAEGIDLNQLAGAMGKAVSQLPEMSRAEEVMLLRVIAGEVKRGNDPSSALARLTGQATLFGGDRFRNMMELETLGGIANERSAGSGQADNAVGMLANNLLTHAKAMTKTQGHTEMGPDGKLLSPFTALMDIVVNAKGNVATIEKELGLGQRGAGPMVIALNDIYTQAEVKKKGSGAQAGMDYLTDKFVKQAITDEQIDEDLKTRLTSGERIEIAFRKLRDSMEDRFEPVLERMIPVFESLIPKIENIFDKLLGGSESLTSKFEWAADKIQWVMDHIVSSVEIAMAMIVAKAALGQVIGGIGSGISLGIGNMLIGGAGATAVEGGLIGVGEAAGGAAVGLEGVGVAIGESLLGPIGMLAAAVTVAAMAFNYMNEEQDKARRAKEEEGKHLMQERMDVDNRRRNALTTAEAEEKAARQSFAIAKENVKKKHSGIYAPDISEQVQVQKLENDVIEKSNKTKERKEEYTSYHQDLDEALQRDTDKLKYARDRFNKYLSKNTGRFSNITPETREKMFQEQLNPDEIESQVELREYFGKRPWEKKPGFGVLDVDTTNMSIDPNFNGPLSPSEEKKLGTDVDLHIENGKAMAYGMKLEIIPAAKTFTDYFNQNIKIPNTNETSTSGKTNPTSQ